jgi:hypothetical protein
MTRRGFGLAVRIESLVGVLLFAESSARARGPDERR